MGYFRYYQVEMFDEIIKSFDCDEQGFIFQAGTGTGKTEVARILSRILYDAGVLDEAKLVETDAHGLIGKYIGETAPKTLAKINDAMGGVLFIDEAYSLVGGTTVNGGATSYGEEATFGDNGPVEVDMSWGDW